MVRIDSLVRPAVYIRTILRVQLAALMFIAGAELSTLLHRMRVQCLLCRTNEV